MVKDSWFVRVDADGKWYQRKEDFVPNPPPEPEYTLTDVKKDLDEIKAKLGI